MFRVWILDPKSCNVCLSISFVKFTGGRQVDCSLFNVPRQGAVWQNEVYVHFREGTCGARVCACHVGTSLAPIPRLSFVAAPSPAAHFHADPASSAHAALARATVQRVAFRVPILVWTIGTDPRDVTIWVMHVRKHRCACAYFLRSSSSFFCCCFRFSSSSSWSMSFTRWF